MGGGYFKQRVYGDKYNPTKKACYVAQKMKIGEVVKKNRV